MYVCCNSAEVVSRGKKEEEEKEEARDQTADNNHL
jgi:hypothetical protein